MTKYDEFLRAVLVVAKRGQWNAAVMDSEHDGGRTVWPSLILCRRDGRVIMADLQVDDRRKDNRHKAVEYCLGAANGNMETMANVIGDLPLDHLVNTFSYHIWTPKGWGAICDILEDGVSDL